MLATSKQPLPPLSPWPVLQAKHTRDGNCRPQILVVYIRGTFWFFLKSDKLRFPLFKKTFLYTYSSAVKTATSGKTLHDATVSTIATSKIPCDLEWQRRSWQNYANLSHGHRVRKTRHPSETVLVIDLSPQLNASRVLLGSQNFNALDVLMSQGKTISFYIHQANSGWFPYPENYLTHVSFFNDKMPKNIKLLAAERLIIPVNADDFSLEALKSVLYLVYGIIIDHYQNTKNTFSH